MGQGDPPVSSVPYGLKLTQYQFHNSTDKRRQRGKWASGTITGCFISCVVTWWKTIREVFGTPHHRQWNSCGDRFDCVHNFFRNVDQSEHSIYKTGYFSNFVSNYCKMSLEDTDSQNENKIWYLGTFQDGAKTKAKKAINPHGKAENIIICQPLEHCALWTMCWVFIGVEILVVNVFCI